jgi:hypothetical protein
MDRPETRSPCVVVHGLQHARIALACGLPVTLLSGPGAALYAGCGWWRALADAARAEHPGRNIPDILDCADAPGYALEALRVGQRTLILSSDYAAFALVAARAEIMGAQLLGARPPALDLAQRGAERRLEAWLTAPETARRP